MNTVFPAIREALERGEGAVLCAIVSSSGSTPRGAGAKMAVFQDGATAGTIGGGAVEYHAAQAAREALATGRGGIQGFRLAPNQVQDIGMICGGDVTVCFSVLGPSDLPMVSRVCDLLEGDQSAWLVTRLDADQVRCGIWEVEHLAFLDLPEEQVRPLLGSRGLLSRGEPKLYVEPLNRRGTVYLFGAGHVGLELAPVLSRVGFRLTVFDDRPHALTRENFPTAQQLILGDFAHIDLHITADDYVVIMTSGHQGDYAILAQVLRTPATYIGCIGSRRKAETTKNRLKENGFTEADIQRIHSPIGLPIGGETPAEIAISVAAEMIAHRWQREQEARP